VDPLIELLVPERYYDRYGKLLASSLYELPVLEGLSDTTLESGWVPLRLLNSSGVALRVWDAITQSPRMLITGSVGSGKSTLLRFLAWRLLTQPDEAFNQWWTYKLFKQSTAQLCPVLIDLRRLDDGDLLATVLSHQDSWRARPRHRDAYRPAIAVFFSHGLVRMWLRENEMLLRFAQQKEGEA
jgi:hypothetical protein